MDYIAYYNSPLGPMTLASDGDALSGLWFDGQKYDRAGLGKDYVEKDLPVFQETREWLTVYFSGKNPDFTPRLRMKAGAFRREVWEILLQIPYGQTMTYKEIAERVASNRGLAQMSAQAVGGAVGHNSISIIIPCHRVIGSDGSLTGYAGGIDRKAKLLEGEKHAEAQ